MFSNFGGGGGGNGPSQSGQKKEDDASLDNVLPTPALKLELVVLVMLSMDQMRKSLSAIFDPSITATPSPPQAPPSPWAQPEDDAPGKPPTYKQATKDLNHADYLRRKRELAHPEIQELQKSLSQAYGNWRVQVLRRVAEVLRVKPDVAKAEKAKREAVEGPENLIVFDDEAEDRRSKPRYPAIKTQLADFSEADRILLVNSLLLLLLLSLEHYSSYSRLLLLIISSSLKVPPSVLNEKEDTIAHGLLAGAQAQMSAEDSKKRDNNKNAAGKAWKVGLATVAGAAVIGLTGGLAAPLLAGAVGSVLGGIGLGGTAIAGLLGGLAGNIVLVGGLFGAYGGSMTGKMMEKYAKEVEDFEFIPLRRVDEDKHRLRVVIGITGWLSERKEVYLPWLVLGDQIEGFVLQWEVEVLKQLGGSMLETFKELAVKYAAIEIIKRTIFAGLLITLWPLGLLRIGKMLSNSFSVAQTRADRAGEVMADALIHKAQGERPVTLIGYSLGARVIYSCLRTLAKRRAFGLVESAVLLGAPISAESENWRAVRAVVADRVVNAYSRNDYILGLVYRTSSITPDVAGLQPIEEVAGVENVDVSDLVSGHLRYRYLTGQILERIGYEALDPVQVVREKEALERLDAQEKALRQKAEAEKGKKPQESGDSTDLDSIFAEEDPMSMNNEEITARLKDLKVREGAMEKRVDTKPVTRPLEEKKEAKHFQEKDDEDSEDEAPGPRITMMDSTGDEP